ncbi:MAG: hypothetical protein CM15mP46_4960 [Alphaproteobacteria bacterium]|nr:MAG: hypothetical protein CM15mP46_4960 [Alphaproteobacteria bacterium]
MAPNFLKNGVLGGETPFFPFFKKNGKGAPFRLSSFKTPRCVVATFDGVCCTRDQFLGRTKPKRLFFGHGHHPGSLFYLCRFFPCPLKKSHRPKKASPRSIRLSVRSLTLRHTQNRTTQSGNRLLYCHKTGYLFSPALPQILFKFQGDKPFGTANPPEQFFALCLPSGATLKGSKWPQKKPGQ